MSCSSSFQALKWDSPRRASRKEAEPPRHQFTLQGFGLRFRFAFFLGFRVQGLLVWVRGLGFRAKGAALGAGAGDFRLRGLAIEIPRPLNGFGACFLCRDEDLEVSTLW